MVESYGGDSSATAGRSDGRQTESTTQVNQDDPRPLGVGMHTHANGHAQSYQVGQGSQHVHHHHYGGEQTPTAAAAVVVEQIVSEQAAARSLFVGRRAQVDQLLGLLDPSGTGPGTAAVSAIGGLGGVGKTTLARHVAQAAVGRGWFPGGAVWVDLYGYALDPGDRIIPGQVFGSLLRALGVPAEQIPPQPGEQAAAYHQHLGALAEAGRPVLVVLDNASSVDQVTGLLPAHRAHRAVVTSRHTLGELDGARIVDLDVLDTAEAVDLVDQALRERESADQRAVTEPDGAAGLVGACGRLPLALRIAAALLADDAAMTVTGLADELADTVTRLDTLAYGSTRAAATFDLSWQHLNQRDPAAARLFGLLPVNPGPDLSTEAAAVVADLPVGRVRPLLRVLRRAHLVQSGTGPDRWTMHDLVGAYAAGLHEDQPGDRTAATERLLGYYTTTADAADDHLRALPGQPVPDRFTGRDHALEWLDAERANLTAAVTLAAATGDHHQAVTLANALAGYLSWRRYLDEWVTVTITARDAATHLDNPHHEAIAWGNLGNALREVRRFNEAIDAHTNARNLYQQTGDRRGEGTAWNNLGLALAEVGRFDEAIDAHTNARNLYQQTGDRRGEGTAWNSLGLALAGARRFNEAIDAHTNARELFQTGDWHGEGQAWNNLGNALWQVGRFDEAITAHQRALEICLQTGDRHGEGTVWNNLGAVLVEVGRFDEAIDAHQHALEICLQTGDRHREAIAWGSLGNALARARRFDEAIDAHTNARNLYQQTDDRHREASVWNNLGNALREVRRFDEAIDARTTARNLYQQIGDRHREAMAWGSLGLALAEVGRFDEAITAIEHAVAAFTESGAVDDAADARRLAQAIKDASGRPDPEGEVQS